MNGKKGKYVVNNAMTIPKPIANSSVVGQTKKKEK